MVFIFRILILICLCMTRQAGADIVGGEEVRESDPVRESTVALYGPGEGGGGSLCTASIIGKDTAITAAHCIRPGGPKPIMLFGRNVRSGQAEKRSVTAVRVNPRWKRGQRGGMDEGDIALVKFKGGLPRGYRPVAMASDAVRKGGSATLAGYGISNARSHSGAGVLRKTRVRILDPRPGKTEMVLDQSRGHGACHGDSGGPAFVRHKGKMVLAGVTNRSHPAGAPDDCAHQVVYTKVDAYRSWIEKEQKRLHQSKTRRPVRLKKPYRQRRLGRVGKARSSKRWVAFK